MSTKKIDHNTYELALAFTLQKDTGVYQEHIVVASDSPDIALSAWHSLEEPTTHYDSTYQQQKKIYLHPFTLITHATIEKPFVSDAHIYLTYYQYPHKKIKYALLPLSLGEQPETCTLKNSESTKPPQKLKQSPNQLQTYLRPLIIYLQLPAIRYLLIFIFALLLSIVSKEIGIVLVAYCLPLYFLLPHRLWLLIFVAGFTLPSLVMLIRKYNSNQSNRTLFHQPFALIMSATVSYYGMELLPKTVSTMAAACILFALGIFYLYQARITGNESFKRIKNVIGIAAIAGSVIMAGLVIKLLACPP